VIQRVVQLLQEVEAKLATMASLSGESQGRPVRMGRAEPGRSDEQPQLQPRVLTSHGEVDELFVRGPGALLPLDPVGRRP
jgi:hypothetical protein